MKYHITIERGIPWLINEDGEKIGYLSAAELADLHASSGFALMEIEKEREDVS